jgi:hypothetical protein
VALRAGVAAARGQGAPPADPTGPEALQLARAWPSLGERLLAEGDAALYAARRLEGEAGEAARRRARDALARACALAPAQDGAGRLEARASAALARAEVAVGDLPAAERALARAEAIAPRAWETTHARAVVALARGHPDEAVAAATATVDALDQAPRRLLERAELTREVLVPLFEALEAGQYAVDAAGLADLISRRADEDRLPLEGRLAAHQRLLRLAEAVNRPDLVREARARGVAAQALTRRIAPAARVISGVFGRNELSDTPELREAVRTTLTEMPLEVGVYLPAHAAYMRYHPDAGMDTLALGFECCPGTIIEYLNSPSFSPRAMPAAQAATVRESILRLCDRDGDTAAPDPDLPYPRDDGLRFAVAGLYCADLRAELSAPRLAGCLDAAATAWRRRPCSRATTIALGRLLITAGAAADALDLLQQAEPLPTLCAPERRSDRAYLPLYEALALGAERRWPAAAAALERARADGLPYVHRLREEPLFWDDRTLSGTLVPQVEAVAKEMEAAGR